MPLSSPQLADRLAAINATDENSDDVMIQRADSPAG
jgi:hypothetical protein